MLKTLHFLYFYSLIFCCLFFIDKINYRENRFFIMRKVTTLLKKFYQFADKIQRALKENRFFFVLFLFFILRIVTTLWPKMLPF